MGGLVDADETLMKYLALFIFLAGCVSSPPPSSDAPIDQPGLRNTDPNQDLKGVLGMNRPVDELGFEEKPFNPCNYGAAGPAGCGNQYFGVLHFQLLCRDSEGTVMDTPVALEAIVTDDVQWKVGGISGSTSTDERGYGQLSVVSARPSRGARLILRMGPQFVAFEVSEVSKIVLPRNFCRR